MHLVETGQDTNTGGRVGAAARPCSGDGTFMLTYGDGVADVDLHALLDFHRAHGRAGDGHRRAPAVALRRAGLPRATARSHFTEKPQMGEGWINGGFMVLEPGVLDYIDDDATSFESDTLEQLAAEDQLRGVHPRGVLAGDGHAARGPVPAVAVGPGRGALGDVVSSAERSYPRTTRRTSRQYADCSAAAPGIA